MANKRVASENGYEFLIVYNILGVCIPNDLKFCQMAVY